MAKIGILITLCIFWGAAGAMDVSKSFDTQFERGVEKSSPFGHWLFSGEFSNVQFNASYGDYIVKPGDEISVQMWGAVTFNQSLTVDKSGFIFIENVGPIKVAGVKSELLQSIVSGKVMKEYNENAVGLHVTLDSASPIRVFVAGFVGKPGLYEGSGADSLLRFIDLAGGVNPDSGSYREVIVKRSGKVVSEVDLYDFLLNGDIPMMQLRDGDTIFVGQLKHAYSIKGQVSHSLQFEYITDSIPLSKILDDAVLLPDASHVRITNVTGPGYKVDYLPLAELAKDTQIKSGSLVEVVSDKLYSDITLRIEGEHLSSKEVSIPYGSTLGSILNDLSLTPSSDMSSVRLYRDSVKSRQKDMINSSLQSLQNSVLNARSSTSEASQLRAKEAELVMQWVSKAKEVEPKGQVILAGESSMMSVLLEPGDVIYIPRKNQLVSVYGDVYYPSSRLHSSNMTASDYLDVSGGITDGDKRFLLHHPDGTFTQIAERRLDSVKVGPGDELLVLPVVDEKKFQSAKDWTEIIYQIAIAAAVVL